MSFRLEDDESGSDMGRRYVTLCFVDGTGDVLEDKLGDMMRVNSEDLLRESGGQL